MDIKRTDEEIDKMVDWAMEGISNGTRYAGLSYEDGIRDFFDWLEGRKETSDMTEE